MSELRDALKDVLGKEPQAEEKEPEPAASSPEPKKETETKPKEVPEDVLKKVLNASSKPKEKEK